MVAICFPLWSRVSSTRYISIISVLNASEAGFESETVIG